MDFFNKLLGIILMIISYPGVILILWGIVIYGISIKIDAWESEKKASMTIIAGIILIFMNAILTDKGIIGDMENTYKVVGIILNIILKIIRYPGIVLFLWGLFIYVLSSIRKEPDAKNVSSKTIIAGLILICLNLLGTIQMIISYPGVVLLLWGIVIYGISINIDASDSKEKASMTIIAGITLIFMNVILTYKGIIDDVENTYKVVEIILKIVRYPGIVLFLWGLLIYGLSSIKKEPDARNTSSKTIKAGVNLFFLDLVLMVAGNFIKGIPK